MTRTRTAQVSIALMLTMVVLNVPSSHGQKIDSYISDMGEALVPNGTANLVGCHSVLIELKGPWSNFAIPDGLDPTGSGQPTWTVLKFDLLRIYVDLTDLDEDKIQNHAVFSLDYISKHKRGTPYIADTPTVMFFTKGLNKSMVVHTVDLNKVDAVRGRSKVTEADLGLSIDERRFAMIAFADQEHADVFQKALQKAIVVCKSQ